MATEADLIQKFKDLNIPVGADFEELIHAAFASANLADQINSKADDSKVVHTADMRKPAGDVAGIDEVSALQTQVDNSAVGINLLIGTSSDLIVDDSSNTSQGWTRAIVYNNLIAGSVYTFSSDVSVVGTATSIDVKPFNPTANTTIDDSYTTFPIVNGKISGLVKPTDGYNTLLVYAGNKGNTHGNKVTLHHMKLEKGSVATDWCPNPADKVNVADMRKPANDVAGIEEVNAKQDKLTITPADDSKVAHLSGANNFDNVPTVNNNPLLLASSLPSDLARTSQQMNFTAGLQSGGIDVATAADLKSVEDKAWRQLDNKYITISGGTVSSETTILFRIDQTAKRLYLQGVILAPTVSAATMVDIDFSSVVKTISPDTKYPISYAGDNPFSTYSATVISNKLRVATNSSGISLIATRSDSNGAPYVTYDELV